MRLTDSEVFKKYALGRTDHIFDFYRCYKCTRVFTREQEFAALAKMNAEQYGHSGICACGSLKYSPTWPVVWEWLKPSVVRYTLKCVLARGIAPWLERHWQGPLPLVERLVKFKEAGDVGLRTGRKPMDDDPAQKAAAERQGPVRAGSVRDR